MNKTLPKVFSIITILALMLAAVPMWRVQAAPEDDLIITGLIDGPLTGGIPKAVEFYVMNNIPDLSIYGFGSANNGGGTDGEEFAFPAVAATAGEYIYVATEAPAFTSFFGFAPDYTNATAPSINGDDAIELFMNGVVVDVFGDINLSGTGQPWEYLDGWAYRVSGTGPDGDTFVLANWTFSGINALDGETTNAAAAVPFPIGTYGAAPPNQPVIASCGGPLTTDLGTPASTNVSASDADGTVINILINNITPSPAPGTITLNNLVPAGGVGGTATATVDVDGLVPGGNYTVQIVATNNDDTPQTGTCNLSVVVNAPPPTSPMIINELDSDTPGADVAEFVELYDGGLGNTDLTGLVLVFYNGSGDVSYARFDLDGFATDGDGYFLLGNSGVTPDLTFANGLLQNGEDAVALYQGDTADFPNGTAVTTSDLIDALVYDTGDPDDPGLLALLNPSQPQVDENGGGNGASHSSQRCPNGSGGQRNTDTYLQNAPSAGADNNCGVTLTIMQIQDSAHRSPYAGQLVTDVPGIVTAVRNNGFNMQDASGDGNILTSDGIFVFTDSAPDVAVGDSVLVRGFVAEFRPGGDSTGNLSTTELVGPFLNVSVVSSGNSLPAATVIGMGGRVPPTAIINNDGTGNVETSGTFDAATDGIDFYESMEGMLVRVNNAVVVGPTNDFGEVFVLADDGAGAGTRTERDGILIQPGDFNPERIQFDDALADTPDAHVGDHFNEAFAVGVLDYNFGNFEISITSPLTVDPGGLAREVTGTPTDHQLSVASFNVENLSPNDTDEKFETLAELIVNNLKSPDVIGLEEIQDNTGPNDTGEVDADETLDELINAIETAGGPTYEFRQINPVDGEDGGQPGGNIRVGFLFNPDRVDFVDRPGAGSTTAVGVSNGVDGPELTYSPGRIDPENAAFDNSRKPLAGEFLFEGDKVFIVVNHFNSKGGDDPLFGRFQPPVLSSEVQRLLQAQVVNDFVDAVLGFDPDANVIVLGDLNDFQFSAPLATLKGDVLVDLVDTLPLDQRYTYVFEGNSQALDHILASNRLADALFSYDIVHVNSEFHDQISDHEPEVALMCVDRTAPSVTVTATPDTLWPADHKYVNVSTEVTFSDNADGNPTLTFVSATSNEADNGADDGNTVNDVVVVDDFNFKLRAERSGIGTGRVYTITYTVTDACGNSTTASTTVTVPLDLTP